MEKALLEKQKAGKTQMRPFGNVGVQVGAGQRFTLGAERGETLSQNGIDFAVHTLFSWPPPNSRGRL